MKALHLTDSELSGVIFALRKIADDDANYAGELEIRGEGNDRSNRRRALALRERAIRFSTLANKIEDNK